MQEMTGIQRMSNFLKRQPHDRIPVYEHFWTDTKKMWAQRGWVPDDVDFDSHFQYDMCEAWSFDLTADLDYQPVVLEETEETILKLDGNGAKLRRHKLHDTTPEHVGFTVTERNTWEELIKPKLLPEERRIYFQLYRETKAKAAAENRFFCWSGVNVFESIHPVCGHEHMLVGMALDPEWVKDMANTYAKLTVELMEILFEKEGKPDGIWFYEDLGFKERPFMSPAMYQEIIEPAHKYTIDFAKSQGLPVIMHSCGCIEQLLPGMMRAGIDCLQVIEVKAGMDIHKLYRQYGENLSFMGGMDVRELYTNDIDRVETELRSKIPAVCGHYGYALHSDHSIPESVNYDVYQYFLERGKALGRYKG